MSDLPRIDYPVHEGCLGKAWKQGLYFDGGYPNPVDSPDPYMEKSLKDGMPRERVEMMRMKARMYCGIVVWNKSETNPIGVLMLEASYDRYSTSLVMELMRKQSRGHLSALIDAAT